MKKNHTAYLLIIFFSFQSCIVYQKSPVSMSQAVDQGRVKVIDSNGQVFKYKNIVIQDSLYLGIRVMKTNAKPKGSVAYDDFTIEIDIDEIAYVLLKDKLSSNFITIFFTPPLLIGLFLLWLYYGPHWG